MAYWQGVNVNTGTVELPKYNAECDFEEVYIASVGSTVASGDTIYGPVIQAGLFVTDVKVAVDKLDSAGSGAITFEAGYQNSATTVAGGFIATGNTTGQAGGIQGMNVATGYGQIFANNTTVIAVITNSPGTGVAGNMRIGTRLTASP